MGDEWGSQIGPDDEGPCQKVKDLGTCLKTRLMLSSKYFWNSCSEPSNAPFHSSSRTPGLPHDSANEVNAQLPKMD